MQEFEFAILDGIQNHLRCGFLDVVLPFITRLCDHGEIWIVLAAVLLLLRKKRRSGGAVAGALVLDVIGCNLILKPLFDRVRPFVVNSGVNLLVDPPLDASFPSGHTAASFAAVFALLAMKDPLWKPALAVAVVMAFSRLYLYVHWPSDILGGILVGAAAGWGGAWLIRKFSEKAKKERS